MVSQEHDFETDSLDCPRFPTSLSERDYVNVLKPEFFRLSHVFTSVQMLPLWTFAVLLGAVAGKKRCVWRWERLTVWFFPDDHDSWVQAMIKMRSQVSLTE